MFRVLGRVLQRQDQAPEQQRIWGTFRDSSYTRQFGGGRVNTGDVTYYTW
jgi:hypothetical protein